MNHKNFLIAEGAKVKLKNYDPNFTGDYENKQAALTDLQADIERLSKLQDIMYAQNKHTLLVVFQAMDAAGKDSVIKHVMTGLNPQGVSVVSFKQPSTEEREHDFLWRISKNLPERGRIGIFNRSHYEEVLVVRVHKEILQAESLPDSVKNDKNIWQKRFEDIRNYENYLTNNGVSILKFFLNVSREEQKKRFLARISTPEKNWKFAAGDVTERLHWNEYMKAYEELLTATSTKNAPWYVIPADHKWFTRAAVADIIAAKLESLDLQYPQLDAEQLQKLAAAKELLENERS
ncbi:MAG: polyphosphate kinase 2 family protein [Pyrinomonadaceae bacterium]|nr:polyphosphate kinase 2 family protein [Pyrinomonadaceae bacterium]